jgi:hypothetical protein
MSDVYNHGKIIINLIIDVVVIKLMPNKILISQYEHHFFETF